MSSVFVKSSASRCAEVYIAEGESIHGRYVLTAVEQGVSALQFKVPRENGNIMKPMERPQGTAASGNFPFPEALAWLEGYLSGESRPFPSPIHFRCGSPFQQRVWKEVFNIPRGSVSTYSRIAALVGTPSARAVGTANGRNPLPLIIPCHRVVRKDGALGGYGYGLDMKIALLEMEGVPLIKTERGVKVSPHFLMDAAGRG